MTLSNSARFQQTTLRKPFTLSGPGMHTGCEAQVTVRPAPAGAGVVFISGSVRLEAHAGNVVNTRRCTCLGVETLRLDTVEHLLSALYGLQVDNVEVEIEGPELPILDGSALPWVEAIRRAGIEGLHADGAAFTPAEPVAVHHGDSWIAAVPAESFSVTALTDYQHPLLGPQAESFGADPEVYVREIAPARTFGFAAEVEALLQAGLARGGSLENALIVYNDHFSDALRVPRECLRHKVLDLWGDLSLVGGRLNAAVTAVKPGHKINTEFAALLRQRAVRA